MVNQLTSNAEALRLFFTEDIYLVAKTSDSGNLEVEPTPVIHQNDQPVSIPPQNTIKEFKYLGKNQKYILILVNDAANDVSTPQGRELLRKLVKAIDLTANDFALVNYSAYKSDKFADLYSFFNCKLMIAFGIEAIDLDIPVQPLNQLVNYNNSTLIFAKNLHDLDEDQASKKILWASLQQLKS